MCKRVAIVDENRVVTRHPRPTGNRGNDGGFAGDAGCLFDTAMEQRPDDRFVHEGIARLQFPLGSKLRHASGGTRSAGRAINRLVAIEDGIAGMRFRARWRARPQDMAETIYLGFLRMLEAVALVQALAQHRAPADEVQCAIIGKVTEVFLRIDNGIEVSAIGDVDRKRSKVRAFNLEPLRIEEGGNVGEPHARHVLALLRVFRDDGAGWRIELERARRPRTDQTMLYRHGDGADRTMTAHWQAARGLDEQDRDVAILSRWRV